MRMRATLLPFLVCLAGCGGRTPGPEMPAFPSEGPPGAALRNGLWVDVTPHPGTGVVALHLRLAAGSIHERPDSAGAAYAALESFLGEEQGLRADVRRLGGQLRGWVTRDATAIEVVVGKEQLGEALARLAEQLSRRTALEGDWRALQRRLDEAQQRARLDDERRGTETAVADLFDAHPLARAPLPDGRSITELLPNRVTEYLEARYRPDGARLVVVGDTTAAEVASEAGDAFGAWLGKVATIQTPPPTAPPELGLRMLGTRSTQALLVMVFPAEAPTPGDGAALDVVAALAEARLEGGLRRAGIAAEGVRAYASTPSGGGFVLVRCRVPADAIDEAWQALVGSVVADAGQVPSPDVYAEARRRVYEAAAPKDVEGEARWRAAITGRWPTGRPEDWSLGLGLVDPDSAAERARRVLRVERAASVILAPDPVRTDDDGPWVARLVEQAFALSRPAGAPPAGLHRTEGLAVVLHPMAGATAVGLVARVEGGAAQVPAKFAGVASMVAAGLAEAAEGEPTFEVDVAADHILISTEILPEHLGAALEALERRLGRINWDPARVEAVREQTVMRLRADSASGAGRVEQLFSQAARLPDPAGTEAALAEISPGVVRAWYGAYVHEAPLTLVIAGAVDTRMLGGLERRFRGRLAPDTRPADAGPAIDASPPPQRVVDGPESFAMVGYWWVPQGPNAALAAATLELLAGPDGPLAEALPPTGGEARPFLRLVQGRGLLGMTLRAPRDRSSAARTALDQALDKLVALPVDAEQLAAVSRRLATRARVNLRTPAARARWLVDQAVMGTTLTSADALDKWAAAVGALKPPQVQAFLRQTILRTNRVEARVDGGMPAVSRAEPAL